MSVLPKDNNQSCLDHLPASQLSINPSAITASTSAAHASRPARLVVSVWASVCFGVFTTVGLIDTAYPNGIAGTPAAAFDALRKRHDAQWLVELTACANYFALLSGVVNAFEVVAPADGDKLPV